ncbi:MAG: DAK2 domain-containing protein [Lachnospiraceae bacterium]|nr:DAK2 domain-containing protein [Lachnospiraceae bacterium]
METNTITAEVFKNCFLAGCKALEADKEHINELNVFPVPDGDTGTNMTMTVMSAAKEVLAIEDLNMETLSKAISSGSLRGARGNSGVILSQLFRGFTKVIKKEEEITVPVLCEAMQKAVETAYKAVMKPKEGTILTVARAAADKALELSDSVDNLYEYCDAIIKEAEDVLLKTPDMLPVLKQAGVVDSGGQGLVRVLRGGCDFLSGKEIDLTFESDEEKAEKKTEAAYTISMTVLTESAIEAKERAAFQSYAEGNGDHVDLSFEKKYFSLTMHTDEPLELLKKASELGVLQDVSLKNKSVQKSSGKQEEKHVEPEKPAEEMAEYGFIAISCGEGLSEIFTQLGADMIIEGGQTMNPSTDDILNAVEKVHAKNIFVLPNNKNIILAAEQAAKMSGNKKLYVVPTKTVPQGITAMINFLPDQTPEDNLSSMKEEIKNVKTGQITYAVRDTIIDDKEIKKGDYMGIGDQGIISVNKNMNKAIHDMLDEMVTDESGIISVYYGSDVKEKDAAALEKKIQKVYPGVETDLQSGGQPVYYYIFSVE